MHNPQMKNYGASLLASLATFFGVRNSRRNHVPRGNKSLPQELQAVVKALAIKKRANKLLRPQGWYNG